MVISVHVKVMKISLKSLVTRNWYTTGLSVVREFEKSDLADLACQPFTCTDSVYKQFLIPLDNKC